MTAPQIQTKLESMKGRAYEYAKQVHIVKSYTIDQVDEKFTIKTDKNEWTRKFESAGDFFKYWYDTVENRQLDKVQEQQADMSGQQVLPEVFEKESCLADELISILKDNIKKVSSNPNYIKQAQVVDKNVSTILNVQKVKLEMYKVIKGGKGK